MTSPCTSHSDRLPFYGAGHAEQLLTWVSQASHLLVRGVIESTALHGGLGLGSGLGLGGLGTEV
jgi:hypothetical protein